MRNAPKQLKGADLDAAIEQLTGVPNTRIEMLRTIANRTKHADSKTGDQAAYDNAVADVRNLLRDAQQAATVAMQKTIL